MKNNEEKILQFLQTSGTVNCKQIAKKLSISERTVRYCIKGLRDKGFLIDSNESGYTLRSKTKAYRKNEYDFSNKDERINYLIEKILFSSNGIDIYDLADMIFISYSTIEKDLLQLRKELSKYDLVLKRNDGIVSIEGSEKNKRLIIFNILNSSKDNTMQSTIDQLCSMSEINYSEITNIVNKNLLACKLYASDYSLKSIIIHILINITRIKISGFVLSFPLYEIKQNNTSELSCAIGIYKEIKKITNLDINEFEIQQLAFVIASKTTNNNHEEGLINVKENSNIKKFVLHLIKEINNTYFIDLNDEDFISFFTLHLTNAFFRAENNVFSKNPLSDKIYIQNPVIYDVAVFIAQQIKKYYSYDFNKDEITFISLHVGAIIEKKSEESKKIKALLLIDKYYNYQNDDYLKTLNIKLNNSCEIINIANDVNSFNATYCDFIINMSSSNIENIPNIKVSLFPSNKEFEAITNFANEINKKKKNAELLEKFRDFFDESLFEKNHYENSPEEMISYLCNKFQNEGIADENYKESVLEREKITPTSFDNYIAMPHSMSCSTSKNCGAVIINEKPMKWGYFEVNIIILIGINNKKRSEFKILYNELLNIFNSLDSLERLLSVNNAEDFIYELLGYYSK